MPFPDHIAIRRGGDTFILSSGQLCHHLLRATQVKYGKFAYSASFGYSIPTGSYRFEEYSPASTLILSDDGGDMWKTRHASTGVRFQSYNGLPVLISNWKSWGDVDIDTYLIQRTDESMNWHIRARRVRTGRDLLTTEGTLAIYGCQSDSGRTLGPMVNKSGDGTVEETEAALTASSVGAVKITELRENISRTGRVIRADPNSNLIHSHTVLPSMEMNMTAGSRLWFVYAVFALPAHNGSVHNHGWLKGWVDKRKRRSVTPA